MTKTTSLQDLNEQIERLIGEHIAGVRAAATAAVERAFANAGFAPVKARRSYVTPSDVPTARCSQRRTSDEMAALAKRFYQAVCAKPGAAMAVLALDLGSTHRELNRPVLYLKRTGQIRSVGQRNLTRYFPLVGNAADAAG